MLSLVLGFVIGLVVGGGGMFAITRVKARQPQFPSNQGFPPQQGFPPNPAGQYPPQQQQQQRPPQQW